MTVSRKSDNIASERNRAIIEQVASKGFTLDDSVSEEQLSSLVSLMMDVIPDLFEGGELSIGVSAKDKKSSLEEDINAVLESHGVALSDRPNVLRDFAASANQADDEQPAVEMPDTPTEMWKAGQGETALEFLDRVYGPQVEARLLTYTWLAEHNPALGTSVRTAGRRLNLDLTALPVTQSEANQQSYDRLVARIGEDVFNEVVRVASVMQKRTSRSKNDSDELDLF